MDNCFLFFGGGGGRGVPEYSCPPTCLERCVNLSFLHYEPHGGGGGGGGEESIQFSSFPELCSFLCVYPVCVTLTLEP